MCFVDNSVISTVMIMLDRGIMYMEDFVTSGLFIEPQR
jgi:hypothetical protein